MCDLAHTVPGLGLGLEKGVAELQVRVKVDGHQALRQKAVVTLSSGSGQGGRTRTGAVNLPQGRGEASLSSPPQVTPSREEAEGPPRPPKPGQHLCPVPAQSPSPPALEPGL